MQDALACVALPTCPLALAEGQRYLPTLIPKIDALLATHGLSDTPIHIRMTGCPNGCARPYVAEIGLVGKAAGRYALRLGGDAHGLRLNRLYKEEVDEAALLAELDTLFAAYKTNALPHEGFGDFTHRTLEYLP
jgi:sulfite reductase (NADPH) hemoprotein beta-component